MCIVILYQKISFDLIMSVSCPVSKVLANFMKNSFIQIGLQYYIFY